jgi:hypothetical protein
MDRPLRRRCQLFAASPPNLSSGSPMDESVRLADKGLLDPPHTRCEAPEIARGFQYKSASRELRRSESGVYNMIALWLKTERAGARFMSRWIRFAVSN